MCQLCTIKDITSRDRWPKPLEPNVQEILALLPTAHQEATNHAVRRDLHRKAASQDSSSSSTAALDAARASLLETLAMLDATFKLLSDARVEWWNSPAKKLQRREWSTAGETAKLTELQKVNQRCVDMVADMGAVVGRFRRWNLDVVSGGGGGGEPGGGEASSVQE